MIERKRSRRWLCVGLTLLFLVGNSWSMTRTAPQRSLKAGLTSPLPLQGQAEVSSPRKSDITPQRLDQIKFPAAPVNLEPPTAKPVRLNPRAGKVSLAIQGDGALQSSAGPSHEVTMGPSFDGLGEGFEGLVGGSQGPFVIESAPPDTTGAVGKTQFVQWVNTSFAIFDKKTGKVLLGQLPGKALWKGLGGSTPVPCEVNNDGDPVVEYDKQANRWVLSQFSVSGGTFAQCIAVSETSDAAGRYFRYEYELPAFNDYPKMGVWPDGYYVSYNMFDALSGARACAYDRKKMLKGDATALQQCFQLSSDFFGILPSDLDGKKAPPSGSPNYFVGLGTAPSTLVLWRFHADWAHPSNSTFGVGVSHTPDATISVARFNFACSGSGSTCIPQPGTARTLDSLGERLMFRLAYRNLGSHEALVVNNSVDVGPPANITGVRWYEIRDPRATQPTIFQQGSFAPDMNHRWMGSLAMDKMGDIAAAYNIAGGVNPGIRFASRTPLDPSGILGAETSLQDGGGMQDTPTRHLSRWGDYSGLTVDPADDCTFWYTGEYQKNSGIFNWHTRIASFKLKTCK
jgi:hypothetical protein